MAEVLSTISGTPRRFATSATIGMSVMWPPGLAIDSQKIARVSSSTAAPTAARSSMSTNLADQPKRRNVWVNCVTVPP